MSKKVILISFTFSLVGLIAEFLMFVPVQETSFPMLAEIQHLLSIVQIRTHGFLEYARVWQGPRIGFPDLMCYLMLFAGAILYRTSTGRETRLIRFVLSIIMMSNVLTILFSIVMPSAFRSQFQVDLALVGWILYGVTLAKNAALVYFSYQGLQVLRAGKMLVTVQSGLPEEPVPMLQEASGAQRFMNALIDLIVCVLIFLPLGTQLVPEWLSWMEETFGSRNAVVLLLVIARTIYYILFEMTLAATPGKFMTETRVMDVDGDPAIPGLIVKRTLSRFIPFEPLSFFWNGLWHDNISYTRVVQEEQTGVDGGVYLFILPAIIALGIILYNIYGVF
jgi:uncharacterized RDD family membrane protein YckC